MGKGMCRFEAYRAERHAEEAKNGDAGGVPWWEEIGLDEPVAKKYLLTAAILLGGIALLILLALLVAFGVIPVQVQR